MSPTGTPSQNGAALLAALAGITDASSSKPYLLKIEPGFYDVGDVTINAKANVDIEGSGRGVTFIEGESGAVSGVLEIDTSNVEVRDLSVFNNDVASGGTIAIAINVSGAAPTLTRLDVHVTTQSSPEANAINTKLGGAPTIRDVTVNARTTVANGSVMGISISGASANSVAPVLERTNVTALGQGATAVQTTAIRVNQSVLPRFNDVIATASAASGAVVGIQANNTDLSLTNVTASAGGGGSPSYGLVATGTSNHTIRDSHLIGPISVFENASMGTNISIRIAHSELEGTTGRIGSGTATFTCFGVYDANFQTTSCP